jgi:hypothetical protein
MKRLLLLLPLMLALIACEKESDNGNGSGPTEYGVEDYYPLQVGHRWVYAGIEIDSLDNEIPGTEYNSTTTVIGDTLIGGNTYFIQQDSTDQEGSWQAGERQYARYVEDSLKFLMPFFDDPQSLVEMTMAILPGDVGDTWVITTLDTVFEDSSGNPIEVSLTWTGELLDFGSLAVPAGNFDEAVHLGYEMTMEISTPDTAISFGSEMKVWAAPLIGPAQVYQSATFGPDGYKTGAHEQLTEYFVGEP